MGIYLELVNFDNVFHSSEEEPVIINDLSSSTEDEKARINKLISTRYVDTDLLSNDPTCECGELKGGYNLGVQCPNCRTKVREPFEQEIKPLVWIKAPVGVAALMNPTMWNMLNARFTKADFRFIEWLCNTDYQPTSSRPNDVEELLNMGVKRGYNNFVNNFDDYINKLISMRCFRETQEQQDTSTELLELIRDQRDCIFSSYLPLPNKTLMVIEDTESKTYVDPLIVGAMDAIRAMQIIDDPLYNFKVRQKENRTVKAIDKLSKYYVNMYRSRIAKKGGWIRKHIFGSRNHFSCRAVITSNTVKHAYDEISIGWSIACTLLKVHITNKLLRRGFTPNQASGFIQHSTLNYNQYMDDIFTELMEESPDKCLYCSLNRNPTMGRGSIQRMRITTIKKDPADPTITLSILAVSMFNADFDGDEENLILSLDNETSQSLTHLAPHKNMISIDNVRTLSDAGRMPKPVASTVANWLHTPEEVIRTPEQEEFIRSLG